MIRRSLILLLVLASLITPPAAQAEAGLATTAAQQTAVPPDLTYSTLLSLAQSRQGKSVPINHVGREATVVLTDGNTRTVLTPSDTSSLSGTLAAEGVDVTYENSSHGGMPAWLPLLGLGFIGVVAAAAFFGHRSQKKTMVQVADQAKEAGAGTKTVRFADVAGGDEASEELRDTVDFLKAPELFEKVG